MKNMSIAKSIIWGAIVALFIIVIAIATKWNQDSENLKQVLIYKTAAEKDDSAAIAHAIDKDIMIIIDGDTVVVQPKKSIDSAMIKGKEE